MTSSITFVERLQQRLRNLSARPAKSRRICTWVENPSARTERVLTALRQREQQLRAAGTWKFVEEHKIIQLTQAWCDPMFSDVRFEALELGAEALVGVIGLELDEATNFLLQAILGAEVVFNSIAERTFVRSIVGSMVSWVSDESLATRRYVREIAAVRVTGGTEQLLPFGEAIGSMNGRDAVRALIAVELQLSQGAHDPWRVDREFVELLLEGTSLVDTESGVDDQPFCVACKLARLNEFGLVFYPPSERPDELLGLSVAVTPDGVAILEEALRGNSPFSVLASTTAADHTDRVLRLQTEAFGNFNPAAQAVAQHAQMVAHELKNKLAAARGRIELAEQDLPAVGEDYAVVLRHLNVVRDVVNVLGEFADTQARIAGAGEVAAPVFDPGPAVESAISYLAGEVNGRLRQELATQLPVVPGSREKFVLLVAELLRNAASFAPSDGVVFVRLFPKHNRVVVSVEDNGPGVAADDRDRIFEDGYSTRGVGRGRGLAFVRRLAHELNGSILCGVGALGGALFECSFPTESR